MRTREVIEKELALAQNLCVGLNKELRALNAKELGKYHLSFAMDTDDDFELDIGDALTIHCHSVHGLLMQLHRKLDSAELLWGCEGKWQHTKDAILERLNESFTEWKNSGENDNDLPYCHLAGNQQVDVYFNLT